MGTWGTAIFSDDLAADVRDMWRALIGDGLSPADATDVLLAEYREELADQDGRPVFWLALALTQHRAGRLEARVLEGALAVIDDGSDLARWAEDPALLKKRTAVLAKTRQELESPQPPPKHFPKHFRNTCEWEVGEVIAYRLPDGDWIPLHVVQHFTDRGGTSPVVQLLDWRGPIPPTEADLGHAGVRPPRPREGGAYVPPPRLMVGATSARERPTARLRRLGIVRPAPPPAEGFTVLLWRQLDGYLETFYDMR